MKNLFFGVLLFISSVGFAQTKQQPDSLGLPGDNLNLYAVLDLFRESETLDGFEKKLNDEKSKINNLDLNNDNKTDYIKVIDSKDGNNHLIVLQIDVSDKEKQDVAVITVNKENADKVKVQIVGDPELYGKDYIIEPNDNNAGKKQTAAAPNSSKKTSDTTVSADGKTVIINNTVNNYYNNNDNNNNNDDYKPVPPAHQWVIVHYIYGPSYVVYASPWYWGYYPPYWNPWTPWFWHQYYWHHHHHYWHHHYYYNHAPVCYSNSYKSAYAPRRSVSDNFAQRKMSGAYQKTYSRPDLGKPTVGRPNPGYNGPAPTKNGPKGYPTNTPRPINPPKQGAPRNNGIHNAPPPQKMGPKSGGAPMQKMPGGGGGGGRRR